MGEDTGGAQVRSRMPDSIGSFPRSPNQSRKGLGPCRQRGWILRGVCPGTHGPTEKQSRGDWLTSASRKQSPYQQ